MKITIITFGKLRESFYQEMEAEYIKRFTREVSLEFLELNPAKSGSVEKIKKDEAEEYFKRVPKNSFKIVLDETGGQLASEKLASFINDKQVSGTSNFSFAIGGAAGWDKSVVDQADLVLSLSAMTFPHQLARVVLVEQLYRAWSILRGSGYHK